MGQRQAPGYPRGDAVTQLPVPTGQYSPQDQASTRAAISRQFASVSANAAELSVSKAAVDLSNVTSAALTNLGLASTATTEAGKTFYNAGDGTIPRCWASPRDYKIDLRDAMDGYYGVGAWVLRTSAHTGTDIGPAINWAATKLRSVYQRGKIIIPPIGVFRCVTPPDYTKFAGLTIEGPCGSQGSVICFDPPSGEALFDLNAGATGGFTGGGIKGLTLSLEVDHVSDGCTAIYVEGTNSAGGESDQMELSDLYINNMTTGGSIPYWYGGLYMNGTDRVPPLAQGIRVGLADNIQIFNCYQYGVQVEGLVQWHMRNLGTYTPKASTTGADFIVTGGGSSGSNTFQLTVERASIGGSLHLSNSQYCAVRDFNSTDMSYDTTFDYYDISGYSTNAATGTLGSHGRAFINGTLYVNGTAVTVP